VQKHDGQHLLLHVLQRLRGIGHGSVSVGGLRLGASVSLCLGELAEPQEVGAQVQQAHDAERVRLTFTRIASIDVVLKHLRALRWHLSHQCCACGTPLESLWLEEQAAPKLGEPWEINNVPGFGDVTIVEQHLQHLAIGLPWPRLGGAHGQPVGLGNPHCWAQTAITASKTASAVAWGYSSAICSRCRR
jgi:hypothetical protein